MAVERAGSGGQEMAPVEMLHDQHPVAVDEPFDHPTQPNTIGQANQTVSGMTGNDDTADWEPLGVFSEFLGADFIDTYWDFQDMGPTFASNFQNINSGGQDVNVFDI
jgi:hypothetical protein